MMIKKAVAALCDLCVNPWPYMCAECDDSAMDEPDEAPHPKVGASRVVWVGSGEDFPPQYVS